MKKKILILSGGRVPAPIWKEFMEEVVKDLPIENWPEVLSITNKELNIDLNLEKNFGPQSIQTSKDQPDFVWINGESLGDDDPALAELPDLPVIFVFDATLLKSLNLSTHFPSLLL